MPGGHARALYRLRSGGDVKTVVVDRTGKRDSRPADLSDGEPSRLPEYEYRFGVQPLGELPSEEALEALADKMTAPDRPESCDSVIPAGYTYLGQFIFHDITWLKDVDPLKDRASAVLDLDSVLGNQFRKAEPAGPCPVHGPLRVGLTAQGKGAPDVTFELPEDLPRKPRLGAVTTEDKEPAGYPLIPDLRNDDFLSLAQTHLALIKFYNAIARWYGFNGQRYAEAGAKRCFVQHFHSVVLHDYLQRLIDPAVYADVMAHGRRIIHPGRITESSFRVPIEFAAAAGRYGHSMIRGQYNWNDIHRDADFENFYLLSHRNSEPNPKGVKMTKLPREWIIDWARFYDFREFLGGISPPGMTKKIDTRLTAALRNLPERIREHPEGAPPFPPGATFNLASVTLLKQRHFEMASAQRVIELMNADLGEQAITALTEDQISSSDTPELAAVFEKFPELRRKTPIWFYVLKEAELSGQGNRLGPMGSRIVMETIHASVDASQVSILHDAAWSPSLPRRETHRFTMPDLIVFAGNVDPLSTQVDHTE
jgi:hypothetical protein